MDYRRLGRTGLKVAPLCLGGNVFGWTSDEPTSFKILDAYTEQGGNFIDTADAYSSWVPGHVGGESETVLGNWLARRKRRDDLVVTTKVATPMGKGPNQRGLSRLHIMNAVEASLRRLQTDYIDLYLSHWNDPDTTAGETMRAFDDLVSQGKVRYVGVSNHPAWRITQALWESDKRNLVRYECVQPLYNLVARADYERELMGLCLDQELGVMTYSSLASGFLSGKYRQGQPSPKTPRAQQAGRHQTEKGFAVLAAVDRIAAEHETSAAAVALAWVMARPGITAPIASATSLDQLNDLMAATELTLSPTDIASLNDASA
jgi:aryl-alcohol dehydrogenase-like predicted oxidoreductase